MGFWSWLFKAENRTSNTGSLQEIARAPDSHRASDGEVVATLESPGLETVPPAEEAGPPWWAPEGATLTEPPEIKRPRLSTEARALESLLISHFDGHDLSMPPLPSVVERTLAHLRDRECNLRAVADDISDDQVIAAAVLRMTNSPLYRGLHKITALRPAVTRLGTKALQTLLMHESLRAAMFHGTGQETELAQLLWNCSLASACSMRELSCFTTVDEEDAFLIGLLHDIGNVIVLRIAGTQKKLTQYEVDIDTFDYLCAECHQEFGELVAEHWKLPDTVKALIGDHHTHPEPDDPLRNERLLVQLSDMINAMLGYAPSTAYNLMHARVVQDLGWVDRPDFRACLDELPRRIEETLSSL